LLSLIQEYKKRHIMNSKILPRPITALFVFLVLATLIGGIFLRSYALGDRALHHDETLHAIYSKYPLMGGIEKIYQYDPLLHGPLLYNLNPLFLNFFGESNEAVRLMPSLASSLLLVLLFVLWLVQQKREYLLSFLFLAFSPTLIYWGRFLFHEPLVHLTLGMILFFALFRLRSGFFFIPILIILQFTIKANAYLHLFLALLYLVSIAIFDRLAPHKAAEISENRTLFDAFKKNWKKIISGILVGSAIYAVLFSSWFHNPAGILDGIFRKTLPYWFTQHQHERISGPFCYQFLTILWYETPLLIFAILHTLFFYIKRVRTIPFLLVMLLIPFLLTLYYKDSSVINGSVWSTIFKLKLPLDFYLFFIILLHTIFGTIVYSLERKRLQAGALYVFGSLFFTYSFVGEKVPWLSSYIVLALIAFAAINLATIFRKNYFSDEPYAPLIRFTCNVFVILVLAVNLFNAIRTNLINPNNPIEFIRQVQTSKEFENSLLIMQAMMKDPSSPRRPVVYVDGESTWPSSWFLYGEPNYVFGAKPSIPNQYDVLITNYQSDIATLYPDHISKRIALREWWLPNYDELSFINLLNYTIFREVWNETGAEYRYIWQRRDLMLLPESK